MPEGQYHLAMATLYLATAPKSNSVGSYWAALAEIEARGTGEVPIYLRDKSDRFRGSLREHYKHTIGEHAGYKYPHAYGEGWVDQRYLPEGVEGGWFKPQGHGYEAVIAERLAALRRKGPRNAGEQQKLLQRTWETTHARVRCNDFSRVPGMGRHDQEQHKLLQRTWETTHARVRCSDFSRLTGMGRHDQEQPKLLQRTWETTHAGSL